jgi:hypothetical protein
MLLSAHQVHHELAAGQLAALPHPDGRVVRAIGLTTRAGWQPTNAQQELLAELRRQAQPFTSVQANTEPPAVRNARVERRLRRVRKGAR